jgi:hypothetical protein
MAFTGQIETKNEGLAIDSDHFLSHLDLLPDGESEYSSSNVGLDCYLLLVRE